MTEPTTEPITYPPITYGSNFPFDLNTLDDSDRVIHMMVTQSAGLAIGAHVKEHGTTITVHGSCDPDFKASAFFGNDCAGIAKFGLCDANSTNSYPRFHVPLRWAEQKDDGSWSTFLHCPECGCTTTDFPNFYELAKAHTHTG